MKKQLITDSRLIQEAVLSGLKKLKDAVAPTLGPLGSLVILDRLTMFPVATKDGANIAREVESEDKLEDMAIRICKEISKRTEEEAGDGTTSSIIMAQALVEAGVEHLHDYPFFKFKQELESAEREAQCLLDDLSKRDLSDEDLLNVLRVSSNYDEELSTMILEIVKKTNRHGSVLVEEARGLETSYEVVPGFSYEKGVLSPYFYTDPQREEAAYKDAAVLVMKGRLDNLEVILPILGHCGQTKTPLLVVADDISPEILTVLIVNKMQNGLPFVATQVPHTGERHWSIFDDIALISGASIYEMPTQGQIAKTGLGSLKHVTVKKRSTVLVMHESRDIMRDNQIRLLGERLEAESSQFMRGHLKERISKLSGGIGIIRIGAPTELEMRERKDRAIDAHLAVTAALEDGILPGGGHSLLNLATSLSLKLVSKPGYAALIEALKSISYQLWHNADLDVKLAQAKSRTGLLYNGRTADWDDASITNVLDSTKSLKQIIKNSVSVANILLNVKNAVVYQEDEQIRKDLQDE